MSITSFFENGLSICSAGVYDAIDCHLTLIMQKCLYFPSYEISFLMLLFFFFFNQRHGRLLVTLTPSMLVNLLLFMDLFYYSSLVDLFLTDKDVFFFFLLLLFGLFANCFHRRRLWLPSLHNQLLSLVNNEMLSEKQSEFTKGLKSFRVCRLVKIYFHKCILVSSLLYRVSYWGGWMH